MVSLLTEGHVGQFFSSAELGPLQFVHLDADWHAECPVRPYIMHLGS